jgi:crossover junction endodeoxyribonuclease RusA
MTASTGPRLILAFTVHGDPAPQGSKRHVGRGVLVESSKHLAPWREAVRWAALREIRDDGWHPIDEPVLLLLAFRLRRPQAARRKVWADRQPDLDKLARGVLDALVSAGVLIDDARVVALIAQKRLATPEYPPGVDIAVQRPDEP